MSNQILLEKDDLADLKLLSKDEFEDLKQGQDQLRNKVEVISEKEGSEQDSSEAIEALNENLENLTDQLAKNSGRESVETRLQRVEDQVADMELDDSEEGVSEEDFNTVLDEIERQKNEIQEIRNGYEELGEMMQLVLKQLRTQKNL